MLPSSPLHVLLLADVGRPLVMTSGNVSDEPVLHRDTDARERLGPMADGVLSHNREIAVPVDDSVVRATSRGRVQLVRRARGWAPQPVRLPVAAGRPVLAVGAQLKSTVTLARGRSAVVSQHLGDLDDWPSYAGFCAAIEHLTALSAARPELVAHDLHPDYRSTAWAEACGLPLLGVQHHHAHVAACLVEHGVTSPVLGVAFDGLGLGTDGTLWGGELLVADLGRSTRVGHLRTAALPGGDAAVREPWRTALSWLHRALGPDAAVRWGRRTDPRWSAVLSVLESGRAPETSSVGRLFDAVAALLDVRHVVSYEGQAAVELEALARRGQEAPVPGLALEVHDAVLDPAPAFAELVAARARGVSVEALAAAFHVGLADATAALTTSLAGEHGLDTVALSGGVFSNALLTELLEARLRSAGLRVLVHERLPPNDGSISVGQAAVAAAQAEIYPDRLSASPPSL
jgi:hydrogenase maturation protein HypF